MGETLSEMASGGDEGKNTRGIPPQELYSKYKFMENQMAQHRHAVDQKRPELEKSLTMLKKLIEKRDNPEVESMKTHFELGNCLYANADIPVNEDSRACLWLGANVMLEYTYDEAVELLSKNLEQANETLEGLDRDLDFIKDQITTTEVNIARVYNNDVRERRKAEAAGV